MSTIVKQYSDFPAASNTFYVYQILNEVKALIPSLTAVYEVVDDSTVVFVFLTELTTGEDTDLINYCTSYVADDTGYN